MNFSDTLFDTNDISTVRGSSRAYEDAVGGFVGDKDTLLDLGASKVVLKSDRAIEEIIAGADAKLMSRLSFVCGEGPTIAEAEAQARGKQFRNWTVTGSTEAGSVPCALDGARSAARESQPKGLVSNTVHDRREYGRDQRSRLYGDATVWKDFTVSTEFAQLVESPPKGLAFGAHNKIAVIHADGSGFGDALKALESEKGDEGRAEFSNALRALQADLLARIGEWLKEVEKNTARRALSNHEPETPRFETLLFGGDDMDFVLPGWLAIPFIAKFSQITGNWEIGGVALSHRLACVIANVKTPIRQLRGFAHDAVDELRSLPRSNVFSIDLLESAAPPADGPSAHRKRLFGASITPEHTAFSLTKARALEETLDSLSQNADAPENLRRSQIHTLLDWLSDLASDEASDELKRRHEGYRLRVTDGGESVLPELPGLEAPASLHLAMIAQLWDFAGAMS